MFQNGYSHGYSHGTQQVYLQKYLHFPYPLVICYIAIENGPVEIVSFPISDMVDLSSSLCGNVYQAGYQTCPMVPTLSGSVLHHPG